MKWGGWSGCCKSEEANGCPEKMSNLEDLHFKVEFSF